MYLWAKGDEMEEIKLKEYRQEMETAARHTWGVDTAQRNGEQKYGKPKDRGA